MNRVRLFLMLVLLALVIAACGTPVEPAILEASFQGTGSGTIEVGAPVNTTLSKTKTKVSIDAGTKVTLTAKPAAGSTFAGWGGACSGTALTCSVTMNGGKTVRATFNTTAATTHTVTFGVTGNGTINVMPNDDDMADGDTLTVDDGTVLTLTAVPADAATTFTSWTGACSAELTVTCTVTVTSDTTVGAIFNTTTPGNHNLTVRFVRGLGNGSVSDGAGLACDYVAGAADGTGTCTVSLTEGSDVTLTATPDGTSALLEWGGDDCSGAELTCEVTLDGDKTVTARFVMATAQVLDDVQIASENDSAEEFLQASTATLYPAPGDVVTGTGFIELTYSTRWVSDQVVGLRFPNVNIPVGAVIDTATITFTANPGTAGGTADDQPVTINIYGQDNVAAEPFLDTEDVGDAANGNVTDRLVGATASVAWNITGAWATDSVQETPDVKDILTAITTKDGWDPASNAIVLILQNEAVGTPAVETGRRLVDNSGAGAPILRVTYR